MEDQVKVLLQRLRFIAHIAYLIAAWVLVAMVVAQVFLAGSAVLVNPGNWNPHRDMGHMIGMPIILMFVLSIAGWMPRRFPLLSVGLFVLYGLQYFFLNWPSPNLYFIRAFHPVNALSIFMTAAYVAREAWRFVRR